MSEALPSSSSNPFARAWLMHLAYALPLAIFAAFVVPLDTAPPVNPDGTAQQGESATSPGANRGGNTDDGDVAFHPTRFSPDSLGALLAPGKAPPPLVPVLTEALADEGKWRRPAVASELLSFTYVRVLARDEATVRIARLDGELIDLGWGASGASYAAPPPDAIVSIPLDDPSRSLGAVPFTHRYVVARHRDRRYTFRSIASLRDAHDITTSTLLGSAILPMPSHFSRDDELPRERAAIGVGRNATLLWACAPAIHTEDLAMALQRAGALYAFRVAEGPGACELTLNTSRTKRTFTALPIAQSPAVDVNEVLPRRALWLVPRKPDDNRFDSPAVAWLTPAEMSQLPEGVALGIGAQQPEAKPVAVMRLPPLTYRPRIAVGTRLPIPNDATTAVAPAREPPAMARVICPLARPNFKDPLHVRATLLRAPTLKTPLLLAGPLASDPPGHAVSRLRVIADPREVPELLPHLTKPRRETALGFDFIGGESPLEPPADGDAQNPRGRGANDKPVPLLFVATRDDGATAVVMSDALSLSEMSAFLRRAALAPALGFRPETARCYIRAESSSAPVFLAVDATTLREGPPAAASYTAPTGPSIAWAERAPWPHVSVEVAATATNVAQSAQSADD